MFNLDAGVKKLFAVQYVSYNDIMSGSDVILQSSEFDLLRC